MSARSCTIRTLDSLKLPQLEGTVAFNVFDDASSDPHENGWLTVVVDANGFSLYCMGASAERWALDWAELRHMCESSRMEDAAERMKRATAEIQDHLAQQRFLRGEKEAGVVVDIASLRKET